MDVLAAIEPVLAHAVPVRDVPVLDAVMHDVMWAIMKRRRGSGTDARKRQAHAHHRDENFLFDTQGSTPFFNATDISRPYREGL